MLFLVRVYLIGAQRPVMRRVARGWEAPLPGGAPLTPRGCRGPSCSRGRVGGACREPEPQAEPGWCLHPWRAVALAAPLSWGAGLGPLLSLHLPGHLHRPLPTPPPCICHLLVICFRLVARAGVVRTTRYTKAPSRFRGAQVDKAGGEGEARPGGQGRPRWSGHFWPTCEDEPSASGERRCLEGSAPGCRGADGLRSPGTGRDWACDSAGTPGSRAGGR